MRLWTRAWHRLQGSFVAKQVPVQALLHLRASSSGRDAVNAVDIRSNTARLAALAVLFIAVCQGRTRQVSTGAPCQETLDARTCIPSRQQRKPEQRLNSKAKRLVLSSSRSRFCSVCNSQAGHTRVASGARTDSPAWARLPDLTRLTRAPLEAPRCCYTCSRCSCPVTCCCFA